MSEAKKQATSSQLLVRTGGFALSLPIVAFLTFMLLLVNMLMGVILFTTLTSSGGIFTIIAPHIPGLSLTFLISMITMFVLFRTVFWYIGGMRKMWQRLRGIKEERARVERLMEHQNETSEVEAVDDVLYGEDQHQAKYQ